MELPHQPREVEVVDHLGGVEVARSMVVEPRSPEFVFKEETNKKVGQISDPIVSELTAIALLYAAYCICA